MVYRVVPRNRYRIERTKLAGREIWLYEQNHLKRDVIHKFKIPVYTTNFFSQELVNL